MTPRSCLFAVALLSASAPLVACSAADEDLSAETDEARAALRRKDLPAGEFRDRAEEIAQEWLDNLISSGEARLDAGRLEGTLNEPALRRFGEKVVTDHLKERDERPAAPLRTSVAAYSAAKAKSAARTIGVEAFAYNPDNREDVGAIEKNVADLLARLGSERAARSIDLVTVEATVDDDGETKKISLFLFVNRDSREFVAFYSREGSV